MVCPIYRIMYNLKEFSYISTTAYFRFIHKFHSCQIGSSPRDKGNFVVKKKITRYKGKKRSRSLRSLGLALQ